MVEYTTKKEEKKNKTHCVLPQVINFQDVSFSPLSSSRVLCLGAKPSTVSVPDKLLQLVPLVDI